MKQKHSINRQEFEQLKEMGYRVVQLSPWHYRISRTDDVCIDAFPTTHTYCVKYGMGFTKGKQYTNLIETVENELDTFAKFLTKKNNGVN